MNRDNGGDGIPGELFQILKDDAVKVLHSICQQICNIQQWPQDWQRLVFIPISKKINAKGIMVFLVVKTFLHSPSAYPCHLFLISFPSVRSLLFLSFIVPIFA